MPTLTGFSTGIGSDSGDGLVWWFAIGKQQWGMWSGAYQTGTTITFPIAFGVCYSVCVTSIHNSTGSSYCDYIDRVLSYTNTDVKIYVNTSSFFWIAVGQAQQWGLSNAEAGTRIVTFPITFRLACYSIVATYNVDAEGVSYTYPLKIKSYSISNFTAYVNPSKCFWIATGS